jgi:predicted ferric reductase
VYEAFLRCHQILAIGVLYSLWRHVHSRRAEIYILAASCIFASTLVLEVSFILFRNVAFSRIGSRALISRHNGVIRMTIFVTRPWKPKGGEYVNIWMPSASFWSILQSHPFMIASSSHGPKASIDLVIEPQRGFTQKLFHLAEDYQKEQTAIGRTEQPFGFSRCHPGNPEATDYHQVILSGPHGKTYQFGEYDQILLFAEGVGIAALLQFLNELTHKLHRGLFRTRRVSVFWQLQQLGKCSP